MAGNEHDVNRDASTGQFVEDDAVEQSPSTTTTERVGGDHGGDHEVNRSSSTGKFVKESTVERHPDKTETQQV
jgi:hypothetical protein